MAPREIGFTAVWQCVGESPRRPFHSPVEAQKRAGDNCASDSPLKRKGVMQKKISRACGLVIVGIVCMHAGPFSAAAQEPAQTREGSITTFAPIVERVAPSVVTVFTTQTVSRGATSFPFGDDMLRQF